MTAVTRTCAHPGCDAILVVFPSHANPELCGWHRHLARKGKEDDGHNQDVSHRQFTEDK